VWCILEKGTAQGRLAAQTAVGGHGLPRGNAG
jgi:hypothetical protein